MGLQFEVLSIPYHTKRLVLKALNKCKTDEEAAKELGICPRTLYRKKKEYKIIRDAKGQLISVQKLQINAVGFEV